MRKKRGIQVGDYFQYLSLKDSDYNTLWKRRITVVRQDGCAFKIDYFPEVDGAPLILQVYLDKNCNRPDKRESFLEEIYKIFEIHRDITDEKEFMHIWMAKSNFKLPKEDRQEENEEFKKFMKEKTSSS